MLKDPRTGFSARSFRDFSSMNIKLESYFRPKKGKVCSQVGWRVCFIVGVLCLV